jgi:glycosyltransferase involved in cell wall biosynthesis
MPHGEITTAVASLTGSPPEVLTAAHSVPAISVLMAVRNGARFIDEAIASVLGQTLTDLELVLVDNGSHDGTAERIAAWSRLDPRVRSFRVDRPGLARSLNYAAAQARASVLARLDADDIAEPRRLEVQLAALIADPSLGAIGSNALLIDARGRRVGELRRPSGRDAIRAHFVEGNPFVHSSVVMRRSFFDQVGGYRDGLCVTEDLDLWIRLAEVSELGLVPLPLVRYRVHGGSMVRRKAARLAIADACVRAARTARRDGCLEPFTAGRPQLRRALTLLGTDREAFCRSVRVKLLRQRINAWYLCLPASLGLKTWVRKLAVGIGLKPVLAWSINQIEPFTRRSGKL